MPTKKFKRFKFDFNEDAEPVAELHRYRVALSKRFKTTKALSEYYVASAEALRQEEEERKKAETAAAVTKYFKTVDALMEYYREADEKREKDKTIATQMAKPIKRAKAKPSAKAPVRPRRKALVKAK